MSVSQVAICGASVGATRFGRGLSRRYPFLGVKRRAKRDSDSEDSEASLRAVAKREAKRKRRAEVQEKVAKKAEEKAAAAAAEQARKKISKAAESRYAHYFGYIHLSPPRKHLLIPT